MISNEEEDEKRKEGMELGKAFRLCSNVDITNLLHNFGLVTFRTHTIYQT